MLHTLKTFLFTKLCKRNTSLTRAILAALPETQYPDFLRCWYTNCMNAPLHLDTPETFSEKIQWLKVHDSTPIKTLLADKYRMREWVATSVGAEYSVPLLGVWDAFDDIDFTTLPDQFVLKANHGCSWNAIVTDKKTFDYAAAKRHFDKWMRTNYAFRQGIEPHYKDIPPKIIAEQYLDRQNLIEYKLFCFNGELKIIQTAQEAYSPSENNFFDLDWNVLPIRLKPNAAPPPERPANWAVLENLAHRLGQGFLFVRIDLFCLHEAVYVNEMTFTPYSGNMSVLKPEADIAWGKLLTLPDNTAL